MPGRHRRPPDPVLPADAETRLRAITGGELVVEEGVVIFPGSRHPYLYRDTFRPDGTVDRWLARLTPGPLPAPGPDPSA